MKPMLAVFSSALVLSCAGSAWAAATFLSGNATITHTGNLGGAVDQRVISVGSLPSITTGGVVPLQYNPTTPITNGLARSGSRAGVAAITAPTYFGFAFASTTNLTQSGNLNPDPAAASTLRIDFFGRWLITGVPFGPGNTAGVTVTVVANVPNSTSAFTEVYAPGVFYANISGFENLIRSPLQGDTPLYRRAVAGSEIATRSNVTGAAPDPLPVDAVIEISGALEFRVHNEGGEASLELINDDFFGINPEEFAIPAPGAALIAGLGGLVVARRRRA